MQYISVCETEGLAGARRQAVISEYRSTVEQNEPFLWSIFLCPLIKGCIWVWSLHNATPKEAEPCLQQDQPSASRRHRQPCSSLLCWLTLWPHPHHPCQSLTLPHALSPGLLFWLQLGCLPLRALTTSSYLCGGFCDLSRDEWETMTSLIIALGDFGDGSLFI